MTLDPTKLAGVRSAALAATPGPWNTSGSEARYVGAPGTVVASVGNMGCDSAYPEIERRPHVAKAKLNAAFIALANPATVIEMCDEIERLTKRNVEVATLAHGWMVAHDMRAAGKPYSLPSPADVPAAQSEAARWRAALEPFAEACRLGEISGRPPFEFVGASDYEAARSALSTQTQGGVDHE